MLDLHGKILKLAKSRSAEWALAIVSFSESIFFPIPPDTLIIPMVLANQKRVFKIAFSATIFSVLGGMIGYLIGLFFFEEIGFRLIFSLGLSEQFTLFKEIVEQYGYLFIFVSGITPIPYKIATISSGFLGIPLHIFLIASIFSRGLRFYLVSLICMKIGQRAEDFIKRYFLFVSLILVVVMAIIFFLGQILYEN